MPSTRIVETVDVFEDCHLGLAPGYPRSAPDQLGLDGLEEGEEEQKTVQWGLLKKSFQDVVENFRIVRISMNFKGNSSLLLPVS